MSCTRRKVSHPAIASIAATAAAFCRTAEVAKPSGSTSPVSRRGARMARRPSSAAISRSGRAPSLLGTSTSASAPQAWA